MPPTKIPLEVTIPRARKGNQRSGRSEQQQQQEGRVNEDMKEIEDQMEVFADITSGKLRHKSVIDAW